MIAVIGGQPRRLDAWKPSGRRFAARKPTVDLAALRLAHTIASVPTDYDQGQIGSCAANSLAEQYEALTGSRFSRLFAYFWTRAIEGDIDEDAGVTIPDLIDVATSMGIPPEVDWPYDIARFRETPPESALVSAIHHRVVQQDIVADLEHLLYELDHDQPVILGFMVPASMQTGDGTGLVAVPSSADPPLGGHCVLAQGFDRQEGWVSATCHYGSAFGYGGTIRLPFGHFSGNASDMRAIRRVS